MKIAVIAEGEWEIGTFDEANRRVEAGVAFSLVRRVIGADESVSFEPIKLISLTGSRGEQEKARIGFREALRRGCDAVLLFRDDDAVERRAANTAGLRGESPTDTPWALAMQVQTLEAWLLGDETAFERAFGRPRAPLPNHPEKLWGTVRHRDSNHPKQVYRRALEAIGVDVNRGTALRLADAIEPSRLADSCPEGFGRFREDLLRIFRPFDCVVAVDAKLGIGRENDLPWPKLKADMKHFRATTTEAPDGLRNAVIMGRKTWDSTPERFRPLPNRFNIVISRQALALPEGVALARSLDHALNIASLREDVAGIFVTGGGQIFAEAFAHFRCRSVYLTRIEHDFGADTHIPAIDDRFERSETLARHEDAGVEYAIERWLRRRPGT